MPLFHRSPSTITPNGAAWHLASVTRRTITFGNDLTVVRSNHSIKVGYMYERLSWGSIGVEQCTGDVWRHPAKHERTGRHQPPAGGGNAFASFLLGYANSASTANARPYQ